MLERYGDEATMIKAIEADQLPEYPLGSLKSTEVEVREIGSFSLMGDSHPILEFGDEPTPEADTNNTSKEL